MTRLRIYYLVCKLAYFALYFCLFHLYLFWSTNKVIRVIIPYFGYADLDDSPVLFFANLAALSFNVVNFIIFYGVNFIINLILSIIPTIIFNKIFFRATALGEDKKYLYNEKFIKYSKIILLSLMTSGVVVLLLINTNAFPISIIPIVFYYLVFSFIAYILTRRKIKKSYF